MALKESVKNLVRPIVRPVRTVFSPEKRIPSRTANYLGIQAFRHVFAEAVFRCRSSTPDSSVAAVAETLERDGLAIWPGFLPEADFAQLVGEIKDALATYHGKGKRQRTDGPAQLEEIFLTKALEDPTFAAAYPTIASFVRDPRIRRLFEAGNRRRHGEDYAFFVAEHVRQGPPTQELDSQTVLHSDTYFHVLKAWLYLEDVRLEDAPLCYVKGSHRFGWDKLLHYYRESCGVNSGSPRLGPEEQARLNVVESKLVCSKNTLVIADTHGYHRRHPGVPGGERLAINVSTRRQSPFGR